MDGIHVDSGSDPNSNPMDIAIVEWNSVAGCNFSFESPFFRFVPVCGFLVCCLFRCVWLFKNCCLWHESPSIYFVISYTQLNRYIWYVHACACMCLVALPSVWVTWSDYCVYASNTEYIYLPSFFRFCPMVRSTVALNFTAIRLNKHTCTTNITLCRRMVY